MAKVGYRATRRRILKILRDLHPAVSEYDLLRKYARLGKLFKTIVLNPEKPSSQEKEEKKILSQALPIIQRIHLDNEIDLVFSEKMKGSGQSVECTGDFLEFIGKIVK